MRECSWWVHVVSWWGRIGSCWRHVCSCWRHVGLQYVEGMYCRFMMSFCRFMWVCKFIMSAWLFMMILCRFMMRVCVLMMMVLISVSLSWLMMKMLCRFISKEEFMGEQEKLSVQDRANIAFNLMDRYTHYHRIGCGILGSIYCPKLRIRRDFCII